MLGSPAESFNRIANDTGRFRVRLSRLFGRSHLAPEFVVAILEGRPPASLTPGELLATDLPIDWAKQRQAPAAARPTEIKIFNQRRAPETVPTFVADARLPASGQGAALRNGAVLQVFA
ncbi:hypothetical protein [Sphingomonas sp. MMS24-J13]|uniref:hypothetical protein n=1 Tax=Sphingomonas sp. MMS24-J13 TaxID=3238686 RepID=UPI00384ABDD0